MSWTVTDHTHELDNEAITRLGNRFLVGNGYFGYRGTLDEYGAAQKVAVIVSGLYDQVGDLWREPVNVPNGALVEVEYAGEVLNAATAKVLDHGQSLDTRHAIHARSTTLEAADGTVFAIRSRRFASLTALHDLVSEYSIEASRDVTIALRCGVDGQVWDINGPHLESIEFVEKAGSIAVGACTHENHVPVAVAARAIGRDGGSVADATIRRDGQRILREASVHLAAGVPYTIHAVAACHTGLDDPDPLAAAFESCARAAEAGFDRLLAEHSAAWDARWQSCDIRIDGDDAAQTALRFSLYHLLSVAPAHAENVSIPARGLSGQVYKGAIFWDTEIFMLPFFVHAFPALARNLLLYRYNTLDGARRKAREYGYRGAYFAWESQDTGDDACTLFAVTDVFTNRPMRTYFRDKQIHISADVAYAIWKYFTITGDDGLLLDGGAEVVLECARFFTSCTHYNPLRHRYEILDVTGPDEYHERVNNNAYTNWMVGHVFDVCLELADYLRSRHPAMADDLIERLDFARDLETIREMRSALYRPAPDPSTHLVPQFDGYFGLDDVPLGDVLDRKLHPHEYLGGGNGLATTTQIIKQADVILGLYLFESEHSSEVKAANWEYYEPRTEHGSTLSACSYSLIAAQIGRIDWAYDYFMRTASIDLAGEPKQYVGPLYIGGTHPAANGGAWMSAVLGLCGIRCAGPTLTIEPRLPSHWERVSVPLVCAGEALEVTVGHEAVVVTPRRPLAREITVRASGCEYRLWGDRPLEIDLRAEAATR